jgi:hypothetical protein
MLADWLSTWQKQRELRHHWASVLVHDTASMELGFPTDTSAKDFPWRSMHS